MLAFYMNKGRHRAQLEIFLLTLLIIFVIRGCIIFQLKNCCQIRQKSVAFVSISMWVSSDVLKTVGYDSVK